MDEEIVFIGTFEIPDFAAWQAGSTRMIEFVEANVPGLRRFDFYVSEDRTEGTVLYVHADADSFDQHMRVAASRIQEGREMVRVTRIEILGAPHDSTIQRLRAQGDVLVVKAHMRGFAR
jgi:hypothetical protein